MNKTPITVALERQIPEYVRGEYELFVNFIKAYYEFLNETQQRNLEDVRSIENTLDEFIIRFKKELSVLFPTNNIANERFILQRIREFYQARGSKESYQFLFRILFNKDADVFYPSTQILRASDGKWIQEKSVFVKSVAGNLFNLSGKIIDITTVNKKKIHIFCPRVVYYRDDIYEVFIDRAYVQDISISNKVSSANGADYGTILPCPSKYTITSPGKNFSVGKLYYLKTEKGDGSLVKITKIGTGGSIKKVQVISFGLDYTSIFYAKLSNKQAVAVPYRHPIPGPYSDGNNGFIDYGYINRQDYFYFDKLYTPSIANNQNVFYADGTYVGEIIGSFYTNASNTNVIDADTAEIKIELGAVAIYPGYYSASDGFISDESYIQDGKYYQLFSYVVKVEQQIESYHDIVKELLHPAGMKLYAEYTIRNEYLISASPLLAFIRRQFFEQEYVTDVGINSVTKIINSSDSIALALHDFLQDIKDVRQLKADNTSATTENYFDDDKAISSTDSTLNTSDNRYNDVTQSSADLTNVPIDGISTKISTQLKADSQIIDSEVASKFWDISSAISGTFYQTTTASHSSSNDIKNVVPVYADLTNIPTDGITNKDGTLGKADTQVADSESAGRSFEFTSTTGGTFYQTAIASHSSSNDIKNVTSVYADTSSQSDSLDRTVIYDRSIVPLVSLDPALSSDAYSASLQYAKADTSLSVGGEWSWDGVQYILINPEIRIGVAYFRSPAITSSLAQVVSTPLDEFPDGSTQELVKFSLSGSSWTDITGATLDSLTNRDGTLNKSDTPTIADTFPDGSTQGLVKFSLSGSSWTDITGATLDSLSNKDGILNNSDTLSTPLDTSINVNSSSKSDTSTSLDVFTNDNSSSKSDTSTIVDAFPNGSTPDLVKFSFSGSTWTDVLSAPVDAIPVKTLRPAYEEAINNDNTGTLYYNVYNQNNASDPNSSYSYEAETYSVHDTIALS